MSIMGLVMATIIATVTGWVMKNAPPLLIIIVSACFALLCAWFLYWVIYINPLPG